MASNGTLYKNELCFDEGAYAAELLSSMSLTPNERTVLDSFRTVQKEARKTAGYNSHFTYGSFQIDDELNTRYKDDFNNWIYDYPILNTALNRLKKQLALFYDADIKPKLFEYELLK